MDQIGRVRSSPRSDVGRARSVRTHPLGSRALAPAVALRSEARSEVDWSRKIHEHRICTWVYSSFTHTPRRNSRDSFSEPAATLATALGRGDEFPDCGTSIQTMRDG